MIAFLAEASLFNSPHSGALIAAGAGVIALILVIRLLVRGASRPTSAPQETPVVESSVPDHHLLAIIAAATYEILDGPHRILSVSLAASPSVESSMLLWSLEGRRAICSSHRLITSRHEKTPRNH